MPDRWRVVGIRLDAVDHATLTAYAEEKGKDEGVPLGELGLTGFMWGWAVNAARYCVELPPAPNPAIIEMGSSDAQVVTFEDDEHDDH